MAECPVCLEEGVVFVSMACRHELCELCFEKIMKRSKECPLCRMDLRVKYAKYATNAKYAKYAKNATNAKCAKNANPIPRAAACSAPFQLL